MKALRITVGMLRRFDACPDSCKRFARRWPRGLVLTRSQRANFDLLAPFAHEYGLRSGFADAESPSSRFGSEATNDVKWIIGRIDARFWASDAPDVAYEHHAANDLFLWCGLLADAVARKEPR